MGGFGSGRYSNLPATDEAKRVDIRYMRKEGLLRAGHTGSLNWTCRGEPSGDIRFRVSDNLLTLIYRVREYGGDWEPVEMRVPLEARSCRYGGFRYYFACPNTHCGRRCEILYSIGSYFLCRKCCGYLYSSQKGSELDKLIDAKHKIGKRIFEHYDGDGWMKKKGMHQATFDKGYRKYAALEKQIDAKFVALWRAM